MHCLRPAIPRPRDFHLKYVDDLSVLSAINLKVDLIDDPVLRVKPLRFEERFGKIMKPDSQIQRDLITLHTFTSRKQLRIKEIKTCTIKFNFSKTIDFPVELVIPEFQNYISITDEAKVLGIIISNNLSWESNTQYICNKALKKMWVLRRLKRLDVERSFIVDVYKKEVRSLLEIAVPAWHGALTARQSNDIERVQKVAMAIILGVRLPSEQARALLCLQPLSIRRVEICKKFAKKTLISRHSDIFERNVQSYTYNTRHKQPFVELKCNTNRFYDSPVNYLTRLLNSTLS